MDGIEHIFMRHLSFSKYGIKDLNTRFSLAVLKKHMDNILNGWHPDVIHEQAIGNIHLSVLLGKVVRIIQGFTGVVDRMVWRKTT